MAHINIVRTHSQSHDEILATAESIAKDMSAHFGIRYHWEDERIIFDRPGVKGHIDVLPDEIRIKAQLGLLLAAMKSPIENEVHKQLDKLL